jgi:undecaprenyl-diphosphatase
LLAAAWVIVPLAGGLLDLGLKTSINRPRPPEEWRDAVVHEKNRSYPSGHSMGSMVGLGMVAYAVWLSSWLRSRKIAAIIGLVVTVLAIGFSRIFLRAHWLTDVVGGLSIGLAWLLMCLWLVESWRRREQSQ